MSVCCCELGFAVLVVFTVGFSGFAVLVEFTEGFSGFAVLGTICIFILVVGYKSR